jgi:hypothetical protein
MKKEAKVEFFKLLGTPSNDSLDFSKVFLINVLIK